MSDQYPPAQAPVPQPATPAAPKKSKKGLTIGLVAAGVVVVLGVGAVWAVDAIFGGEKSPEAAADKLIHGALELDPIALYTAMSPAEVKPLKGALEQLEDLPTSSEEDAKNLQETLDDLVAALDITTDGFEYRTDKLMDGVSRVSLTGGTFELDADIDELSDVLYDYMAIAMRSSLKTTGFYSDEQIDALIDTELRAQVDRMLEGADFPYTLDFADAWDDQLAEKSARGVDDADVMAGQGYPFSVVTVDEDGWYTSPLLTVADLFVGDAMIRGEQEYGDALLEEAAFGSPEEAAHGAAEGVETLVSTGDYKPLAAALPLAERRAMSLYGPALDDMLADSGVAGAEISDFDVEVQKRDGLTGLVVSGMELITDGETDATYNHPCIEDERGDETCIDDVPALKALGLDEALPIAIKEGGDWFVSPAATVGNALAIATTHLAQLIEDDELEKLFQF